MLCFPNCKINLGLYVTNRRADGYHDIETVFFPIPLNDALEVVPASSGVADIHLTGLSVAGDKKDNLVWKAYRLMSEKYPGKIRPLDIYLHKVIPMGAGLGGGSADGAFMLKLLNDYCSLGLNTDDLMILALQLGSDCPFFIANKPQFAAGRGERMTEIQLSLSGYSIQLICPEVHISTPEAYRLVTPQPAPFDLCDLPKLPLNQWNENISNDFERPVFKRYPELERIKQQLVSQGAVYASMSGSGSSIFGIFPKSKKAVINATETKISNFYIE